MNLSALAWSILTIFGTSGIAVAAAAWLIRNLTAHLLTKDVEIFKVQLSKEAFEHQFRFSNLHERLATTIAEVYKKLVVANEAVGGYIKAFVLSGEPSEEERGRKAFDALAEFRNYYLENAILFEVETCKLIDEFLKEFWKINIEFRYRNDDPKKGRQKWVEVEDRFNTKIQEIKSRLESTFRKKLGVESI